MSNIMISATRGFVYVDDSVEAKEEIFHANQVSRSVTLGQSFSRTILRAQDHTVWGVGQTRKSINQKPSEKIGDLIDFSNTCRNRVNEFDIVAQT